MGPGLYSALAADRFSNSVGFNSLKNDLMPELSN